MTSAQSCSSGHADRLLIFADIVDEHRAMIQAVSRRPSMRADGLRGREAAADMDRIAPNMSTNNALLRICAAVDARA